MNELEIRELFAQEKQEIEQKIKEHERREALRRVAERNCEWWHFISEEQQDYILSLCIEICDILEKTVISVICELWERLKESFSALADKITEGMCDFTKLVDEIRAASILEDNEKKKQAFFKRKKRENGKIKKFTPPEKQKFRKWRYSVYGHHG